MIKFKRHSREETLENSYYSFKDWQVMPYAGGWIITKGELAVYNLRGRNAKTVLSINDGPMGIDDRYNGYAFFKRLKDVKKYLMCADAVCEI